MKTETLEIRKVLGMTAALLVLAAATQSRAAGTPDHHLVDGITGTRGPTGTHFDFIAAPGYLSTPEGNSLYFWGYGVNNGQGSQPQFSGPTLIVNEGDEVTITLENHLPVLTSLVFPGQSKVTASGSSGAVQSGRLTLEPNVGNGSGFYSATYSFKATRPGTFMYHSGTQPDLQTEMGMVGAIIVRPAGFDAGNAANRRAYVDADSAFDQEYLFLLSDMDEKIHNAVEAQVKQFGNGTPPPTGIPINVDMSTRFAVYWFMNGRAAPDTLTPAFHPSLPVQPYDAFPYMHPGQKVLMRVVGAGSDEHPLHHHGNHARVIAQDASPLKTPYASSSDLGSLEFTVPSTPGSTIDTMYTWTGAGLGWDAYGHRAGDSLAPYEDPEFHLKPFPVTAPAQQHIVDGIMYGGSPFIGAPGLLPPGEGGFNPNNGFAFLWHSHAEKEIVNNDVFPGGMLTFALVEAWPTGSPAPTPGAASLNVPGVQAPTGVSGQIQTAAAPVAPTAAARVVSGRQERIPARSLSVRAAAARKAQQLGKARQE